MPEKRQAKVQSVEDVLISEEIAEELILVKRLASEMPDAHEPETHPIAIRELTLACPRGQVRTRAWDFGGQERRS